MHKIVNTGAPPTTDAAPVSNHPATVNSSATHATGHSATSSGGGGT